MGFGLNWDGGKNNLYPDPARAAMLPSGIERWGIPTPFPVGDVNCYYLPGAEPTLIDPGPDTSSAWSRLARFLEGKKVARVLFTHYHADHAGLAARVQRLYGAEVLAHGQDAAVMRHWREDHDRRQADYDSGLRRAGVPEDQRALMRYGGGKVGQLAETVDAHLDLEDGDLVDLGDFTFRVIHAPGHTSGSMLLVRDDGAATFSGDTLLERITPNALSVRQSERGALPQYLGTLRRLERERLGTILPGHQSLFADASSVIRNALRHAELRQGRLLGLVARPATAYEATRRLFPKLEPGQLFLAVSETLGHLECLRRDGRVAVEERVGIDAYVASKTADS